MLWRPVLWSVPAAARWTACGWMLLTWPVSRSPCFHTALVSNEMRQRELMQGQMSLRWSDYETNNPCAEIELPNVTVKQRVSKLNMSIVSYEKEKKIIITVKVSFLARDRERDREREIFLV